MWKKVCIAALTVFVGLLVVSPKVRSLVRVKFNRATCWANKQVSPETKIEALRLRLRDLAREDERHYDLVARQEVELSKRKTRLLALRDDVNKQQTRLKAMKTSLDTTAAQVSWNGENYNRDYFRDQLRSEFRTFRANEKVLKAEEGILQTMEKTVTANRSKLRELELARTEMKSRLAELERKLAEERLARNSRLPALDSSSYTRLNQDIDELSDEIAVQQRARQLRGEANPNSIKARDEAKARQDALDREIDARLSTPAPVASGR